MIDHPRETIASHVFSLSKEGDCHVVAPLPLWTPAEETQSREGESRDRERKAAVRVAVTVTDFHACFPPQGFKGYYAELRGATMFLYHSELQDTVKKRDCFKMQSFKACRESLRAAVCVCVCVVHREVGPGRAEVP